MGKEALADLYSEAAYLRIQKRLQRSPKNPPHERLTAGFHFNPRRVIRSTELPNEYPHYYFRTHNEGVWKLVPDFKVEDVKEEDCSDSSTMFQVMKDLGKRQCLKNPSLSELNHTRSMNFFIQNWQTIARILELTHSNQFFPRSFIEVDLNGRGRADFVGISSPSQIHLIEVGSRSKKEKQVKTHTELLKEFIPPEIGITPYVARYDFSGPFNEISLRKVAE